MKKYIILLAAIILSSCKREPDITINGQGYWLNHRCAKSHVEKKYGPHYGYDFMTGKYGWHTGSYTETVCDSTVVDTVKVD